MTEDDEAIRAKRLPSPGRDFKVRRGRQTEAPTLGQMTRSTPWGRPKNTRKPPIRGSVPAMVMESLQRLDPPRRLGKLTLLARLGEGGMATVYVAAMGQGALARLAAVKLLRADVAGHDYRTRFVDEARVVVRLHHNNLVDVREAGEHEGQLYIAMELIEGPDLGAIWDRCAALGRAFPVELAVHVVREVLRGLHYAHTFPGLELVHRDVSPSNILVDFNGAVRLADFGLATSALKASLTMPGMVFGKIGYMAPEQAMRLDLDGRVDLYGCGVVLWELLTGRPLRPAGADTGDVAEFEAPAPGQYSKRVDSELDHIVARALARDRDQRWESAAAFMRVLSEWLAAHAPTTTQETVAEFVQTLFDDARMRDHEVYSQWMQRAERVGTLVFTRPQDPTQGVGRDHEPVECVSDDATHEELSTGYVVADRYRIEHALGRGGMGVVYLAEHLTVGRKIAVKVLTDEWSRHPVVARRFQEEARAASAAGHPNIVEVFDAGKLPDGRFYIAMEHLTGRSLHEELQEVGPLPLERACSIIRDVARATKAAHDVGIIHRDLKPDNVMIVRRGDETIVKVLDFGISATTHRTTDEERLTRPGHALGTPEYMAPEQAKGYASTEQFDIYALGVILFEMLTGDPPFISDDLIETLQRKATQAAPRVAHFRPDAPSELVDLVADCLQIDPEARPPSVVAFLERLDRVMGALPRKTVDTRVPRPSLVETRSVAGQRTDRRHVITLGSSAIIAGLAIALLWWPSSPSKDPTRSETRLALADETVAEAAAGKADEAAEGSTSAALDETAHEHTSSATETSKDTEHAASSVNEGANALGHADDRPAHGTPACKRVRVSASEAFRRHDWTAALKQLETTRCWSGPHRDDYVAFRVRALFETRQFDECARFGRNATDREVRQITEACRQRRRAND